MDVLAPVYGLTEAAESAKQLEDVGVDGVFTFEGPHDVFIPLTLAAAATNLSVMTNVAIAFPRNPIHLAHASRDLQSLSGGRFTLGLGTQVRTHIEKRFGEEFDRPVARMREQVEAIRAIFHAWDTGEPLRFEGEFRTHTKMSPTFSPGPSEWGAPPIAVGALGPLMTAMAASVADSLAVMPFTSERFFADHTMPAVEKGLANRATDLPAFEILPELIICTGRDEAEMEAAEAGCRGLLGFYSSTPAYRPVLEHEGLGEIQTRAQQYTREGRWDELATLIPDEMLDLISVRGTPKQVAEQINRRYSHYASRVCVYMPYNTPDGLWAELISSLHAS
jgi:probable F420-dependent oxidoreductase